MKIFKLLFCFVFCLNCYAQGSTGRTTRGAKQKKVEETGAGKKGVYSKSFTKAGRSNPAQKPPVKEEVEESKQLKQES